MNNLQHFLRYGSSTDNKYFKKYQKDASTIVFNGNILCHHTKIVSELLHIDLMQQEYIIDPRTYVFQMDIKNITKDNDENTIRDSYQKLLTEYNLPSFILDNKEPIQETTINDSFLENLIESVFSFQTDFLYKNLDNDIKTFIKRTNKTKKPKFLIAPYFLINANYNFWIDTNINLIKKSLKKKEKYNNDMYAILVIDKQTLQDEALVQTIIEKYSVADGLIFWIDNFDEHSVSENEINALIKLIKTYKKLNPNKEIISLYGGYFMQLLHHIGLNGVCHNLEYGETRSINPGGGQPTHKFYLPDIKLRIDPFEMIKILQNFRLKSKEEFYEQICDCNICKKNINTNKILEDFIVYLHDKDTNKVNELSKDNCINHYLENKADEFVHIEKHTFNFLIEEIGNTYQKYVDNYFLSNTSKININYLARWKNVLSNLL